MINLKIFRFFWRFWKSKETDKQQETIFQWWWWQREFWCKTKCGCKNTLLNTFKRFTSCNFKSSEPTSNFVRFLWSQKQRKKPVWWNKHWKKCKTSFLTLLKLPKVQPKPKLYLSLVSQPQQLTNTMKRIKMDSIWHFSMREKQIEKNLLSLSYSGARRVVLRNFYSKYQ